MVCSRVLGVSLLAVLLAGLPASGEGPEEGGPSRKELAAISDRINRRANWRRYDEQGELIPEALVRPGPRVRIYGMTAYTRSVGKPAVVGSRPNRDPRLERTVTAPCSVAHSERSIVRPGIEAEHGAVHSLRGSNRINSLK